MDCPSCGSPLKALATKCGACGTEISGSDANQTIANLYGALEKAEADIDGRGLVAKAREKAVTEKRGQVIRDFPIPNAREDLQQLLYYIKPKIIDAVKPDPNAAEWRAKFIEVLERAKNAYKGDSAALAEFAEFEKALDTSIGDTLKVGAMRNPIVVIIGLVVLGAGGYYGFSSYHASAVASRCNDQYAQQALKEKERLEALLSKVQAEMSAKDYANADAHAAGLHWDLQEECQQEAAQTARDTWETKRAEVVALIQSANTAIANEKAAGEAKEQANSVEKDVKAEFDKDL